MAKQYKITVTNRSDMFPFTSLFAEGFENPVDAENYIRTHIQKCEQKEDGFYTPHFIYRVVKDERPEIVDTWGGDNE